MIGALALLPLTVMAQVAVRGDLWVPDGQVRSIVRHGNTVYFGGAFGRVGPRTGAAVAIDTTTGSVQTPYPQIDGSVVTVAADGSGGWFVGGAFESVLGQPRRNLAHVLADGSLSPWAPEPDSSVMCLEVVASTLYVGGAFTHIGGAARLRLAALDAATGVASPWDPGANAPVRALAAEGATVYVGGTFTQVGGQARSRLAALDATSGAVSDWNPGVGGDTSATYVAAVVPSGASIYAAGNFTTIGGQTRNNAAAVDASTGLATDWNPNPHGSFAPCVNALVISDGVAYLGGSFTLIGGIGLQAALPRANLAAVDLELGAPTAWAPEPDYMVSSLLLSGRRLFVGGTFTAVGGHFRRGLAAVDTASGMATEWDPGVSPWVLCLASSGSRVVAGGYFWSAGGVARNNAAAMNVVTGEIANWNPSPFGPVNAIALAGDRVYLGGQFGFVGSTMRMGVAAVDTLAGEVLPWAPRDFIGFGNALAIHGSDLIVGGDFQFSGAVHFAMIDTGTALLTHPPVPSWDVDGAVRTLAVHGNTLYVGGDFGTFLGGWQPRVAAIDLTYFVPEEPWLSLAPWWPSPDGSVYAIAASEGVVYLGGNFRSAGYHFRGHLAAIDSVTSLATSWRPEPDGTVMALAIDGGTLYAGGGFTSIAGAARGGVAAFDLAAHAPLPWDPGTDGTVSCITTNGPEVLVGGWFQRIGGLAQGGLALLSSPSVAGVEPRGGGSAAVVLAQNAPNPCRDGTRIRFAIPQAGRVSLELMDLQGRRVRALLRHAWLEAGGHGFDLDTSTLGAGVYWYRLDFEGQSWSRRLAVIR